MSKPPINLLRGWPSPDVLPAAMLSSATQRLLADPSAAVPALQYGPDEGDPRLRAALAGWLAGHFRVEPDPARICVTGGASQALACVLQSFADPGAGVTRAAWLVAPCYHLACAIFEDAGFAGRLRAVPEDEEGIDLEVLERKIRALEEEEEEKGRSQETEPLTKMPGPHRKLYRHIIYAVPTCANPSGKTMSLRRRQGLVDLARRHDALVICDDVYDFLQWPVDGDLAPGHWPDSMRLPRLCDLDLASRPAGGDGDGDAFFGNAISNGSFSKMTGPGVRTGWVEASPAFVRGLGKTGSTMSGGCASQLVAAALGLLVEGGELQRHVETASRPSLKRRHRLLVDAVREHVVPLGATLRGSSLADGGSGGEAVYGGYFVWFTLSDLHFPAQLVSERALAEEELIIGPGNMFAVRGDEASATFDRDIRLCFAWEPEESLVEGVVRLASLLKRMRENRAFYEDLARTGQSDETMDSLRSFG